MAEETTHPTPAAPENRRSEEAQPRLSADFFQKLLNPPACKTTGVCDGCGRCEH